MWTLSNLINFSWAKCTNHPCVVGHMSMLPLWWKNFRYTIVVKPATNLSLNQIFSLIVPMCASCSGVKESFQVIDPCQAAKKTFFPACDVHMDTIGRKVPFSLRLVTDLITRVFILKIKNTLGVTLTFDTHHRGFSHFRWMSHENYFYLQSSISRSSQLILFSQLLKTGTLT